jgi:hypothetical protein
MGNRRVLQGPEFARPVDDTPYPDPGKDKALAKLQEEWRYTNTASADSKDHTLFHLTRDVENPRYVSNSGNAVIRNLAAA